MKNWVKYQIIIGLIGLPLLIMWLRETIPSEEEQSKIIVDSYSTLEFEGIVTKKFINEEEHYYKTVILTDGESSHHILFDPDTSGLYDYIEIGDSLMKQKHSFLVKLKRGEKDTIFTMRFVE